MDDGDETPRARLQGPIPILYIAVAFGFDPIRINCIAAATTQTDNGQRIDDFVSIIVIV
jgi:enoyl-[acyl-carrier-protein] reductase (NADH)